MKFGIKVDSIETISNLIEHYPPSHLINLSYSLSYVPFLYEISNKLQQFNIFTLQIMSTNLTLIGMLLKINHTAPVD